MCKRAAGPQKKWAAMYMCVQRGVPAAGQQQRRLEPQQLGACSSLACAAIMEGIRRHATRAQGQERRRYGCVGRGGVSLSYTSGCKYEYRLDDAGARDCSLFTHALHDSCTMLLGALLPLSTGMPSVFFPVEEPGAALTPSRTLASADSGNKADQVCTACHQVQ